MRVKGIKEKVCEMLLSAGLFSRTADEVLAQPDFHY